MPFDFVGVYQIIVGNRNEPSVSRFMSLVIDECNVSLPSQEWDLFRTLDYDGESSALSAHVVDVITKEPPTIEIKGFWFGINNPVLDSDKVISALYFSGSPEYDPSESNIDWAVNAKYFPNESYFESQILADIYDIAYERSNLGNSAEWALCLAYGMKLAQIAMLKYRESYSGVSVGYAVGFDSGDIINMGA